MTFKDKLNQIKVLLGMQVKLEQMTLTDGAVVEAEQFEPEFSIGIVTEEGLVALPVGTYETNDGMTIVVEQEGIIASVTEKEAEEPETEVEVEAEKDKAEEVKAKRIVESVSKETFFEAVEKLTKENERLKSIKLSSELTVSAYMELPVGTHKIGNDEITVVEVDVPNWDGEGTHKEKRIVSIVPMQSQDMKKKQEMSAEPIVYNPENKKPIELQKYGKPSSIKQSIYKQLFN